jgi:hypothetical protein
MSNLTVNFPSMIWILPVLFFVLLGGIVLVALYRKGDVFAELAHGKTSFRLAARDRRGKRDLRNSQRNSGCEARPPLETASLASSRGPSNRRKPTAAPD